MLGSPVALFVFNRPELTRRVFDAVRRAQPRRLLVVADGPRDEADFDACETVRRLATDVTWPCELLTNFSPANMGCRARMASGLDWVFSQVEQAIILEDDCLPSQQFFHFCDVLLNRFADDERINMIGGSAPAGAAPTRASYFFSRYVLIWGWASWRRAWAGYDVDMGSWPQDREGGLLERLFGTAEEQAYWRRCFDRTFDGHSTWDYQWTLHCWRRGGLTALPKVNLVRNIGFGELATHTTSVADEARLSLPRKPLRFPLRHPAIISPEPRQERKIYRTIFNPRRGC